MERYNRYLYYYPGNCVVIILHFINVFILFKTPYYWSAAFKILNLMIVRFKRLATAPFVNVSEWLGNLFKTRLSKWFLVLYMNNIFVQSKCFRAFQNLEVMKKNLVSLFKFLDIFGSGLTRLKNIGLFFYLTWLSA